MLLAADLFLTDYAERLRILLEYLHHDLMYVHHDVMFGAVLLHRSRLMLLAAVVFTVT